jgi:hypothetical protein
VLATDIVRSAHFTLGQNDLDGPRHVINVDEVAARGAIAMYGHCFFIQNLTDEERDDLLWVLLRSENVIASCYYTRKLVSVCVGRNVQLGGSLAGRVGIARVERR